MSSSVFDPIVKELPAPGYIDGSVVTASVVADADGWFYKPGTAVKISGNKTFAKSVSGDHVVGIVKNGINAFDIGSSTLPVNARILVGLTGGGRRIDTLIAAAAITAGTEIYIDPVSGRATAIGATTNRPVGIVWKGGTASNDEIEVIIY